MKKVVFCLPGNNFSDKFLQCWTRLISQLHNYDIMPIYSWSSGSDIYKVRNSLLSGDKSLGKKQVPFRGISYDYIMWIDSDQVFQDNQFKTLMNNIDSNKNIHILAGVYRYLPGDRISALKKGKSPIKHRIMPEGHLTVNSLKELNKPTKVDISGLGFMLVKQGVFESIGYPWFKHPKNNIEEYDNEGEDAVFCQEAKKKGFDTYIDPSVVVGHEKSIVF